MYVATLNEDIINVLLSKQGDIKRYYKEISEKESHIQMLEEQSIKSKETEKKLLSKVTELKQNKKGKTVTEMVR